LRTLALPNRRPSTKPESRRGRDEQQAQLGSHSTMSEEGQKQTSDCRPLMSAITPKADI
jgi:hypothetical protein